jgi:hypothetical protein
VLTFILIIAVSLGLAFGANALLLKKKPCGPFVSILITAGITIVSAGIGLIVSSMVAESMGFRVAIEKAIGPSIGVAIFTTWGTLNRRKKGDKSIVEPVVTPKGTAETKLWTDEELAKGLLKPNSQEPKADTPSPTLVQQAPAPGDSSSIAGGIKGISKRRKIIVQVTGGLLLLAVLFPPFHTEFTAIGPDSDPKPEPGRVLWGALWAPPLERSSFGYGASKTFYTTRGKDIAMDRLALELAIIAILAGLAFVSVKDKE